MLAVQNVLKSGSAPLILVYGFFSYIRAMRTLLTAAGLTSAWKVSNRDLGSIIQSRND